MTEKPLDRLCRICMNESHSYSLIYEEIYPDNSMLFEVINDVCQLEVTIGDNLPRHICSDCSLKLSEFRKFKNRSHEVRASLERLKENMVNLYLGTECESSLIGNQESIKEEVEEEDSYEYASGRMEYFEDYIGIEPEDLNLSTVGVENHDARPDPLDVDIKNEVEDPLCLDKDLNDDAIYEERELDLKVNELPSCTRDTDPSQVLTQEHDKIAKNKLKAVNRKKVCRSKLLPGNIEGRKTFDGPEEGTMYGSRGYTPCSNKECVNFEGIQNPKLEIWRKNKFECDTCRENSTNKTVINKPELHHIGEEISSNLGQLEIREDDNYKHKMLLIHSLPITNANKIRGNKIISKSGDLKKEKSSKRGIRGNFTHRKYDEKRYCCDTCGKRFPWKYLLGEHITVHTGEQNFQCLICNKSFALKKQIKRHMIVHDMPCHICSICGKEFIQKESLNMHLRVHTSERNYSCSICGRTFKRKSNMEVHLRVHTGEKPFYCSICGMSWKHSGALKRHMILHSGMRPFNCEICEKKFPEKRDYKIHMMRHGDEKPFSCDQCGKSFKVRNDLRVHVRVHEGFKRYKCSICDKAFRQNNNLKVHLRHHTGEKPYPCPKCGKCFSHSNSINMHLKRSCKGKAGEK